MKNKIKQKNIISKKIEKIKEYRKKYKDDLSRISVLIAFGCLSALLIQEKISVSHFIGSFLIVAILLFALYKDIKRYNPDYLKDYKMLLLLGILITGTLLLLRIFEYLLSGLHLGLGLPGEGTFIYGIPVPLGAILAVLIFDFHTALIFSFLISLLTGIWLNDPLYTVYAFIGSLTAAFSVMKCRKRLSLIKGGLYVSAVNITTVGIIMLLIENLFSLAALSAFSFAALSGIIVVAMVSVLLPAIEHIFGITTDISLVELLDLDQPLMRNLLITAPGTYHHSVIVGSLAETAAEAVGVNSLLAKITAHYHDVGKIKMPEYFVENQTKAISKHEKLTPHLSAMILISHVKEGVELARRYKLPQLVVDVIQQHHGTGLIACFYQKAIEQCSDVSEEDYRYPGPKPKTKVAAIVMMADAVEAASRALTDPTPARISTLVEKIVNNIFLDGQIDECELTLKDISDIKRRFTYILTSIFHRRMQYPTSDNREVRSGRLRAENGNSNKEQSKTDKNKSAELRGSAKESAQIPP